MTLVQMFAFTALSLMLHWLTDGGEVIADVLNWTDEDRYYASIIDLGALFSFVLGLSGKIMTEGYSSGNWKAPLVVVSNHSNDS